jgi:hypothetical protein
MRLQEILNENLEWGNDTDKDIFMSLKGLVNKNNGVWKSTKQRWFVTNKLIYPDDLRKNRGQVKDFFGVDINPDDGESLVTVDAIARWAAYGSRSQVPVRYGFVIDDYGVSKYYKIGNKGNLRDGASPDPSKTKLEWTRPDDIDKEHLEPDPEEEKARKKKEFLGKVGLGAGDYVGEEGKRLEIGEVELVTSKMVDSYQVAYNVAYDKFWNMYKRTEDGAVIYHTGKESPMEKGQKAIMTATVKKHLINKKGDRVTVVKIPKFKDSTGL